MEHWQMLLLLMVQASTLQVAEQPLMFVALRMESLAGYTVPWIQNFWMASWRIPGLYPSYQTRLICRHFCNTENGTPNTAKNGASLMKGKEEVCVCVCGGGDSEFLEPHSLCKVCIVHINVDPNLPQTEQEN
jgi:hypothetical protein